MDAQLNIIESILPANAGEVNQQISTEEGTHNSCFAAALQNQQQKLDKGGLEPISDNKPVENVETENSNQSEKSAEPEKTKANSGTSEKADNNNKNSNNTAENTEQPDNNSNSAKEVVISSQIEAVQKAVIYITGEVPEKQQSDDILPKLTNDVNIEPVQKQAAGVNLQANAENPVKIVNPAGAEAKNAGGSEQGAKIIQGGQQVQGAVLQKAAETTQLVNEQGETVNADSAKNAAPEGEKGEVVQQNVQIESKLLNQVQEQAEGKTIEFQQGQQQQQTTAAESSAKQKDSRVEVFSPEKNNTETGTTETSATQLAASVQMQAEQKEGKNSPDIVKNGLNQSFEQLAAGNLQKEQGAEQVSNSNQVRFANQMSSQTEVIERQIQESIQSSIQEGTKQITIRLNPPELGGVSLKFEERNGEITGLLEVSKVETKWLVEQAFPQIIRNLAETGIVIKKLDVTLSNTAEQNSGANSFLNTGQNQQQDFGTEGQSTDGNTYFDYSSEQQGDADWITGGAEAAVVTDNSINILI